MSSLLKRILVIYGLLFAGVIVIAVSSAKSKLVIGRGEDEFYQEVLEESSREEASSIAESIRESSIEASIEESIATESSIAASGEESIAVEESIAESIEASKAAVEPVTVTITAIGDMLMHADISRRAVMADGSYNYDFLFENTHQIFQASDIAVLNNEAIMGGNEIGNVGYPCFNVRDELSEAEVRAGFDVVLSANNHVRDQEMQGLMHMCELWQRYPDVRLLGIHPNAEQAEQIQTIERKGITFALLNYTYGMNGFSLPAGYEWAVDLMVEDRKPRIAAQLQRAREIADFVIVFPHWGIEYDLHHSAEQEEWAKFFIGNGADLIIGGHSHCIQEVQEVTADNGRTAPVFYSLGNYVSLQFYNYSMLGGIAHVSVTKDGYGTRVSDLWEEFTVHHYLPGYAATWVYRLDQFTNEIAATSGIPVMITSPARVAVNTAIPLTVESFKNLISQIVPNVGRY